jgi:hypothetical protein
MGFLKGFWERLTSHDVVRDDFATVARNARFHVMREETYVLPPLPYSLCVVESTLCYQSMVSAHWQMLSLPIPLKLIWFHKMFFFMGYGDNCDSSK